jgi:hypothetical protein
MSICHPLLQETEFRRKLTRIAALPVILLLLLATLLTVQIFRQRAVAIEVDRIDRAISDINHIQRLMIDMETGFRGFLLSGESKFLEPYDRALGSIQSEITLLERALEKKPDQQDKARQIETSLNNWIQYSSQKIADVQASHRVGRNYPDTEGKRRMDALRDQTQTLIQIEGDARTKGAQRWDRELIHTLTLTFSLAILFGILIGLYFRNQLRSMVSSYERSIERFRQSEEQYRALFNGIRDYGIYLLSVDGVVQKWNTGAERITGYSSAEIIGKGISIFYDEQNGDGAALSLALRHAKEEGHYEYEGWRPKKDGSRFWTHVLLTSLYDTQGELRGYSVIMRDHSKRRQLEQEREKLLGKLQEAIQARDEFLTLASHELKTPLTALILRLQMVRKAARATSEPDSIPVSYSVIQKIERQTQRLKNLIDSIRIEQVLVNLLTNALRYSNAHPVRIGIEKQKDDHIRVTVSDQGPGIPPQDKERIFERFGRIKTPLDPGGLGLGLFLSKEIIEAHDGSISVESEPGKGATFILELPV